jgi:branched-chain amino acid transport system permease protein
MATYLQLAADALMLGGVYGAIAVGLSISFGVMRVVNWAHGECLMAAMYIAYSLITFSGIDPFIATAIAGVALFAFGYVLQRYVWNNILERESEREPVTIMLFGAGLGLALSSIALMIFTSFPVQAQTYMKGKMWDLGGVFISVPRFIAFVFAVALTAVLYFVIQKTEVGRAIRATSQNRFVAQLMGIPYKHVYALVFGLGLGLLGMSGGLMVPFFPITPQLGATFGFKAMVIVVLGGKGSIPGALLGGLIVAAVEKFGGWFLNDVYAQCLIFAVFILTLLVKPNGLLGTDKG